MEEVEIKTERTLTDFLQKVDKLVQNSDIDYIDAVLHLCEQEDIEVEVAAKIIKSNMVLKAKVQEAAEDLNFLPKRSTLPL